MKRKHVFFVISTLCVASLLFFLQSKLILLKRVHVSNRVFVTEAQLDQVTTPYLNRSLVLAYFKLPSDVLNRIPKLESADVVFHWPNELELNLNEKTPWLLFATNGDIYVISRDGTLLTNGSESIENLDQLKTIRGLSPKDFQDTSLERKVYTNIVQLIDMTAQILPDLEFQLEYQPEYGWILLKDDTIPIYIGDREFIEDKLKLLRSFLKKHTNQSQKKAIHYIDLRVQSKCIVKYE